MIIIPDWAWTRVLEIFESTADNDERVAFLDGVPTSDAGGVVSTVTVPRAIREPLRYRIPAEAMSEAGRHLRMHRLVRLAQVHTHPGAWTDHSESDDRLAYSQHDGAVSIVVPFHGRGSPSLADTAVHVRDETGWRRLQAHEVSRYVQSIPSVLDFRES